MNKLKTFFSTRKVGWYLNLAALVLTVIQLVIYITHGRTEFDPNYSKKAIAAMCVVIVLSTFGCIRMMKPLLLLQYVVSFYSVFAFLTSQLNLIANIVYSVDGSTFPVTFILIAVCGILAFGLSLAAGIMQKPSETIIAKSELKPSQTEQGGK